MDLLMLYKRETGNEESCETEISVYRSKGRWILDCSDETAMEEFGRSGIVNVPDNRYHEWLQEKVIELLNDN